MKKHRANNIVCGTNDTLGFTVLGGGVWARHAKMDAVGEEERAGARVVKLVAIVALNYLDAGAELGLHIGKEICQNREHVRFEAQRQRP